MIHEVCRCLVHVESPFPLVFLKRVEEVGYLEHIIAVSSDEVGIGENDVHFARVGSAVLGVEKGDMYRKKKTIVEVDRFGLIGGRRKLFDGYRVYIEIFLQVENVFRPRVRHVNPRYGAERNGFHGCLFENEVSLLYHIEYEETASFSYFGISKDAFAGSRALGENRADSCLSILSVVLGICAAGSRALRRLPWRIPCFPPSPAMPPLAPGRA